MNPRAGRHDVDTLYADRSSVRLLKCLCQTEEAKVVAWHTDAKSLERQGILGEFTTKNRVVIISNDGKTLNMGEVQREDAIWVNQEAVQESPL